METITEGTGTISEQLAEGFMDDINATLKATVTRRAIEVGVPVPFAIECACQALVRNAVAMMIAARDDNDVINGYGADIPQSVLDKLVEVVDAKIATGLAP